jgi:hypothetical protein
LPPKKEPTLRPLTRSRQTLNKTLSRKMED